MSHSRLWNIRATVGAVLTHRKQVRLIVALIPALLVGAGIAGWLLLPQTVNGAPALTLTPIT